MRSFVKIAPGDGVVWTEEYMLGLVNQIRWYREIGTTGERRYDSIDYTAIDSQSLDIIETLQYKETLDYELRIFASKDTKTYTWKILPPPLSLAVWKNNVERLTEFEDSAA